MVLPFHIGITYYLVHHTFLKANGAVVALGIANWMIGLGLCLYIYLSRARECWGGFDRRCLNSLRPYLGIMIPCIFVSRAVRLALPVLIQLARCTARNGGVLSLSRFLPGDWARRRSRHRLR